MTKKIIYTLALSLLIVGFGCERYDNIIPAEFDTILSIKEVGERNITLYETGEDGVYTLTVLKGGTKPDATAQASVEVMSDAELAVYANLVGKNYKALPSTVYEIPETAANFASSEQYLKRNIIFKTPAMRDLLESNPGIDYILPITLVSTTDSVNADKDLLLLRPTNVVIPKIGFADATATVNLADGVDKYDFDLSVPFANPWDIVVDLAVNEDLVGEYNNQNGTNYPLLPADVYSITPNPLTIAERTSNGSINIAFKDNEIDYDDFLLPLELTKTSKLTIDSDKKVQYIIVSKLANRFSRSGWTIVDFSSEEKSGEGAGNGVATCVLDGDENTFWHSQWNGGTGELPHHFTIDMQKEVLVTSVDLQRRQNQRDTEAGKFYISSDNKTFTEIGTFEMAEVNDAQTFKVKTTRGRYLKVEITKSRRAPFANMAEVYVRGVE